METLEEALYDIWFEHTEDPNIMAKNYCGDMIFVYIKDTETIISINRKDKSRHEFSYYNLTAEELKDKMRKIYYLLDNIDSYLS